jgi:hypothetical protein
MPLRGADQERAPVANVSKRPDPRGVCYLTRVEHGRAWTRSPSGWVQRARESEPASIAVLDEARGCRWGTASMPVSRSVVAGLSGL